MKISHINWRYDAFGGAETYLQSLCSSLEDMGHSASVVSSRSLNGKLQPSEKLALIDSSFGVLSGYRMRRKVQELIGRQRPDVIHLHETLGFLSPLIVSALLAERPVVQTLHTAFFFCPIGSKMLPNGDLCRYPMGAACLTKGCLRGANKRLALNMLWRKRVCESVDRVIAPSQYIADEALVNGIDERKITVVPHFTEKNSQDIYTDPEENTILFIGRIDPLKGMSELLTTLHAIRHEQWKAYLIGGDAISERLADKLGIKDKIQFMQKVPYTELDSYYRKASILAFPSVCPESFGLVGIEAMSFGRPVVAFDAGGPREWLRHGETGFLVERGNTAKFAEALQMLLRDKGLAARMGKAAMKQVAARFRKREHLKKILSTYEQVLGRRRSL